MTHPASYTPAPQQPDTTATTAPHTADSAHVAATPQQPAATAPQHLYNTDIPTTLLRPDDTVFNPTPDTAQYLLLCNDSLFAPYTQQQPRQRESMFATNTHSQPLTQPIMHTTPASSDWIFATVILLLALVSIYLNNQKFKLRDIFQSLFDIRVLERVSRESNIRTASLLPMVGIYIAAIAMVVLKTALHIDSIVLPMPPHLFFLVTLASLTAFLLLKNGFIRLLGNVFDDKSATTLYIVSNNLFYFVGGLATTPLLLILYYFTPAEDFTLKTTIAIIAIIFITRLFRGMQLILTNSKTSKLYLFYYLCIFEIIPILVIAKIVLL